jgi:hypothetical protein
MIMQIMRLPPAVPIPMPICALLLRPVLLWVMVLDGFGALVWPVVSAASSVVWVGGGALSRWVGC